MFKTQNGEELVVIARREYDALMARLGDADAENRMTLMIANEARSEGNLPAPVASALLRGDTVLRALRLWRGQTQSDLAKASGLAQGYVSDLDSGRKPGSVDALTRIANALDVPASWLIA